MPLRISSQYLSFMLLNQETCNKYQEYPSRCSLGANLSTADALGPYPSRTGSAPMVLRDAGPNTTSTHLLVQTKASFSLSVLIIEWKWHSYPHLWGGISSFLSPAVPILQLYKIYKISELRFHSAIQNIKNFRYDFPWENKIIKFILTVLGFEIKLAFATTERK